MESYLYISSMKTKTMTIFMRENERLTSISQIYGNEMLHPAM